MSIFTPKPSEDARRIMDFLGCPCEYIPRGKSMAAVQRQYEDALAQSGAEHYTPVLVAVSDILADSLEGAVEDAGLSPADLRQKLLSEMSVNAIDFLNERLNELKEIYDYEWEETVIGSADPDIPANSTFSGYGTDESFEIILAKIPCARPWEVLAWLPFGGWNECPEAAEMLAVGKYWYDRFGAVPAVISYDTLEFAARPVHGESAANLALEMYAFCSDVVDQGVQLVSNLAAMLEKSTVWYFWWD